MEGTSSYSGNNELAKENTNEIKDNDKSSEDGNEKKKPPAIMASVYFLRYIRKGKELKKLAKEINVPKNETCLYMFDLKLGGNNEIKEAINTLTINVHEIAAVYFDEIYEKVYTFESLWKENRCFKIFDNIIEAKKIIDDVWKSSKNNSRKVFIDFNDEVLRIHMKLNIFDKLEEIVFNIPKKNLDENEKISMLPDFFKEIYEKINQLEEENKGLKQENLRLRGNLSFQSNRYKFSERKNNKEVGEYTPKKKTILDSEISEIIVEGNYNTLTEVNHHFNNTDFLNNINEIEQLIPSAQGSNTYKEGQNNQVEENKTKPKKTKKKKENKKTDNFL